MRAWMWPIASFRCAAEQVAMGPQARRFDRLPFTSGPPPSTDIVGVRRDVANVPTGDIRNKRGRQLRPAYSFLALACFAFSTPARPTTAASVCRAFSLPTATAHQKREAQTAPPRPQASKPISHHFGDCSPGERSHSLMCNPVSARLALRIISSCSGPGGSNLAASRNRFASSASRASRDWV